MALDSQTAAEHAIRLNLGCGPVQPPGWVNVDGSWRAKLAAWAPWLDRAMTGIGVLSPTDFGPRVRICNLMKRLPFADQSVAAVYAGELWEHFELPDAERLTRECYRVLIPGGVLRVCVPDGPTIWRRYLAMYEAEMDKPLELRNAAPLREYIALYFREICTRRLWASMGHTHKWQFDDIQLIDVFRRAGFEDVARRAPRDSRITPIADVEIRGESFLMVEGVKPRSLTHQ